MYTRIEATTRKVSGSFRLSNSVSQTTNTKPIGGFGMKTNRGFALVLFLLVATLLIPTAFAQETTAGIQGTVKDTSGAVVGNATVEVSGAALIGSKKVQTDGNGLYMITGLPPGQYSMTITGQGFRV